MSTSPTSAEVLRFTVQGDVWPLDSMRKGTAYSRAMGGWLMTYGKIGPDGGIIPTVDREGHVVDAARELGHINWQNYVKAGRWNDTHDEGTIVGLPDSLEFHDGTTELAKAHRKVGFWTVGHLFDRADSRSWTGLTDDAGEAREPTPAELSRADHFWNLAHLLKGTPRPLGLSAHGRMALSACKHRIIYAEVDQAAVCELPMNPDATVEPMQLAAPGTPLDILRKGMDTGDRCQRCSCPAGSCARLAKAVTSGTLQVPEDFEGARVSELIPTSEALARLVRLIMAQFHVSESDAKRWIRDFYQQRQTAAVTDRRAA